MPAVKFMAVDDQIAILGNGNQGARTISIGCEVHRREASCIRRPFDVINHVLDTQSWFHSQEINVMIDSRELVDAWMRCIEANQNTRLYGRRDRDGVLRGEDGEPIQASGVESSNCPQEIEGHGQIDDE
jgi:hypothetical protein